MAHHLNIDAINNVIYAGLIQHIKVVSRHDISAVRSRVARTTVCIASLTFYLFYSHISKRKFWIRVEFLQTTPATEH